MANVRGSVVDQRLRGRIGAVHHGCEQSVDALLELRRAVFLARLAQGAFRDIAQGRQLARRLVPPRSDSLAYFVRSSASGLVVDSVADGREPIVIENDVVVDEGDERRRRELQRRVDAARESEILLAACGQNIKSKEKVQEAIVNRLKNNSGLSAMYTRS